MMSIAVLFLSICFVWVTIIQAREINALRLRVADLDRDLLALEAATYGDGK